MPMDSNRKAWIVTSIFAILPLLGWWLYGLFDIDEGYYGAVVAEMNRRGEWITPFYNGDPWFEKPILLYWVAKPFMLAFGTWVGPRVPGVLATIATYYLVAWFARRRWGEQTARWCVLVAASSLLVLGVGRMMMTDNLLNLCLVGAFVFFYESLVGDRRWRLISAFFLGLSVLAKGPVGILLFLPVAAWTFWREKEVRPGFRGAWLPGILILAATVATWYVPAYLVNGDDFVQKFLVEQNLNRFTGGDAAHSLPFLVGLPFYVLVLLLGMAPWSIYIWKALPRKGENQVEDAVLLRYLFVWALVPFLFFTVSKAKLPHYILPSCVPLAMLVGRYLAQKRPIEEPAVKGLRFPLITCLVMALVANVASIYYYRASGHSEVHGLATFVREQAQQNEGVALYRMARQKEGLGTGKLVLQDTNQPSVVMYLDREVNEAANVDALLRDPRGQWIITRKDRIQASDIEAAKEQGRDLSEVVDLPYEPAKYRLYRLSVSPGPRTRR
jgi:4-amino-4-deoxy-L-arabinose transferase-like glycosyltransferase